MVPVCLLFLFMVPIFVHLFLPHICHPFMAIVLPYIEWIQYGSFEEVTHFTLLFSDYNGNRYGT